MGVQQLYLGTLAVFVVGILLAIVTSGSPKLTNLLSHGAAALGSLLTVFTAVSALVSGGQSFTLTSGLPVVGALTVRIDALSAYFLLALGLVGTAASIYAIGYGREYFQNRFAAMAALFNAFLLSMALVLTFSQVVYFLIAWELMTVVSFLLVNHESDKPETTAAAFKYILMTTIGTAFIASAFLILANSAGSLDFAMLKSATLTSSMRNVVFLCALVGFGTKAGVIPMHIWLPEAHPAAPSHVSALMSGVMVKTAIYMLVRFVLEFLGIGPTWWGGLILALAIISAVLGVLYALMQNDLKRLLAYSSVENIGIILLGLGAGMVFQAKGHPALAALAFAAGLLHVLNHAIFKSLMFMGAGSVLYATHTKNMEKLGGLIKKMPYTAVLFLTGSVAISALPPLNGFVSEWLTFQSLFALPQAWAGIFGRLGAVALVALLGLTGALAATTFVKAFGITFLAKPRSEHAEHAVEVPAPMTLGMSLLALLAVALGLFPQYVLNVLNSVLSGYAGLDFGSVLSQGWSSVSFQSTVAAGALSTPLILAILAAGLVVAVLVSRANGRPKVVMGETWTCGIIPDAKMEYTGTGFAQPVRRAFGKILKPEDQILADRSRSQYHGVKLTLKARVSYAIDEKFYQPIKNWIVTSANGAKPIQSGSLQLYIGYIMAITVILLIVGTR